MSNGRNASTQVIHGQMKTTVYKFTSQSDQEQSKIFTFLFFICIQSKIFHIWSILLCVHWTGCVLTKQGWYSGGYGGEGVPNLTQLMLPIVLLAHIQKEKLKGNNEVGWTRWLSPI